MVEIAINLPQYPEGEEIAIAGLGRFVNGGEAVEIDEDALAAYEKEQGKPIQEALQYNPGVSVDGKEGVTYEPPAEDEEATDESAPSTNVYGSSATTASGGASMNVSSGTSDNPEDGDN